MRPTDIALSMLRDTIAELSVKLADAPDDQRETLDAIDHLVHEYSRLERQHFNDMLTRPSDHVPDHLHVASAELDVGRLLLDPHGHFVYLLWGDDPARPLYVGQSSNVMSRVGQHVADPTKRGHIRSVALHRCPDVAAMCSLEARLIGTYRPPWNIQIPRVIAMS